MFLVMAYRMGQVKGYNYPVGLFTTYEKAIEEAVIHRNFRGLKYDHQIFKLEEGRSYDAEEAEVVGGTGVFDKTNVKCNDDCKIKRFI